MSASRCGTFLQAREDVEMGAARHCDAMQVTGVELDPLPAAKTAIGAATSTVPATARKSHLRMITSRCPGWRDYIRSGQGGIGFQGAPGGVRWHKPRSRRTAGSFET